MRDGWREFKGVRSERAEGALVRRGRCARLDRRAGGTLCLPHMPSLLLRSVVVVALVSSVSGVASGQARGGGPATQALVRGHRAAGSQDWQGASDAYNE